MEWRENAEAEGGDAMQSEIAVRQCTEDTSKPESNIINFIRTHMVFSEALGEQRADESRLHLPPPSPPTSPPTLTRAKEVQVVDLQHN